MNRLDGKVALVSGAARGIGAETARNMAAAGASVVIGDVADRVRETARAITDAGGKALALVLDVTTEASWTAAVAAAIKQFGKLDILVNNAGIFLGKDLGPFPDFTGKGRFASRTATGDHCESG
jgi:NAD(P)-dependent dehydrogenase (short-subunit alcohol dehydrogenase family)